MKIGPRTLLKLKQSQYLIRGTTRPEYAGTECPKKLPT